MKDERRLGEVKACSIAFLCMMCSVGASAAQATPPVANEISYERDWAAQATPYYRVTVREDGSGSFSTSREGAGDPAAVTDLRVTRATREKLFAVAPIVAGAKGCETGSKKQAQTGKKTLTLRRDGTVSTCSFNYSDDKRMQEAVTAFAAIEETLEEAPRLAHLRRFDRLGLDAEIGTFLEAVKGGRAIELENIAPVLRTLAADGDLMERVRNRATDLLAMADAGK